MQYTAQLLLAEPVTHDVRRYIIEKPDGYSFTPGQATEVSINTPEWRKEKRPFTFTSSNDDKVLEFTIKSYPVSEHPDHDGMTEELFSLKPGATLLLDDPWGTIEYKGPGVFIAAGAGITPFLAIFRDLHEHKKLSGHTLIFANKTARDIIDEELLKTYFNDEHVHFILSREEVAGYEHGHIDEVYLKKTITDFSQHFYVCGPPPMVKSIKTTLSNLGADTNSLVFEK